MSTVDSQTQSQHDSVHRKIAKIFVECLLAPIIQDILILRLTQQVIYFYWFLKNITTLLILLVLSLEILRVHGFLWKFIGFYDIWWKFYGISFDMFDIFYMCHVFWCFLRIFWMYFIIFFLCKLSGKGRSEKPSIVNLHAIPFILLPVNFASMTLQLCSKACDIGEIVFYSEELSLSVI